jgi:tetratricopeptide (TPR) repeat protein
MYARQPAGVGAAVRALVAVALVAVAANIAYLPFFQQYVPQIAGVAWVDTPSPWGAWLGMWGGFVVPTLAMLAWLLWPAPRQRVWLVVVIALLIVGVVATSERIALPDAPWLVWLNSPRLWLLSVVLVVAVALLIRPMPRPIWFAVWLVCVGWAVALGVELVYIRDHMDGGEWYRMNTVFKFGMHTWVLLGIAFAVVIGQVWATVLRAPTWVRALVVGVSAVPWLLGAMFPVVAIPNRTAYRINADQVWTLNGLQFMQTGSYQAYDRTIAFVSDYEALQWLRSNVTGVPVVLQSSNEFYRDYGVRIAANTGLPTVVSPLHESEQRDGSVVARRDADVVEFYRGTDSGRKLQILSRYRVAYVIVGPIERAVYGDAGIAVVEQLPQLREVARFGETAIYQVAPNVIAIAPVGASDDIETGDVILVPPPDANENRLNADQLETLEEAFRADTSNIDVMMLLVDAYRQQGRSVDVIATIEVTLQEYPSDVMLLHLYGDALLEAGLIDEGIHVLRSAVTEEPSPGNLNKLITGLIQAGLFEDALREISDAQQVYPDFIDFLVSQGQIYELMGNLEQARQSYQEYLAQAPEDALFREDVRRALANLER